MPDLQKRKNETVDDVNQQLSSITSKGSTNISKRRKGNIKTVKFTHYEQLVRLEKPFLIEEIPHLTALLPEDIRDLYDQLCDISDKKDIVPSCLREAITETLGRPFPDTYFQPPNPAINPTEAKEAHTMLQSIKKIVQSAKICRQSLRHECSWNTLVHGPVLDLVFSSEPINPPVLWQEDLQRPTRDLHVRWESTMSATIAGDSLPLIPNVDNQTQVPCSVSADTQVVQDRLEGTESSTPWSEPADLSQMHSRPSGKKIDYVAALEFGPLTAMGRTIHTITNNMQWYGVGGSHRPHLNHTCYSPLKDSIIALSVETKPDVTTSDPLLQLGLWVAAWHKRMFDIRYLLANNILTYTGLQIELRPRLVTVPLIQVVGHRWTIHFACDQGDRGVIYTGFEIGSTWSLRDAFVLVSSLRAIRSWIETRFRASMEMWFCNNEMPGVPCRGLEGST
ncbi:uncharacterized protein PG998_000009 [Apiospora kogelbergensis]|uniref:uncharacterized protein n=1 Tax=Apiospora kogelbergensis TaxID=1337665 RepID=UPI0031313BE1